MSAKNPTPGPIAVRQYPLVWIKKLILYESINPWTELRQIHFSTGLNIVQGVVAEEDESFPTGHGIGKTTLCRLIRYCLGENSFGQKHVVEEVKHGFPGGYVGAVVVLDGTEWSVLRPLGTRLKEYAMEDVPLEGLLQATGPRSFDVFVETLSGLILANLPADESLSGGQTLQWLQVLAMCSRDQETRFAKFWHWRDTRSDSETPPFKKRKVDAGLCVRAIHGLIDPAEPMLRAKVEQLDSSLEKLRDEIKKHQLEPTIRLDDLRKILTRDFGMPEAADAPIDDESLLGLQALVNSCLDALRREVSSIEAQLAPLDRRISLTAASIMEPAELAQEWKAASQAVNRDNDTLLADIERLRTLRSAETALCRYGDVLIGDCNYYQARLPHLDAEIRDLQKSSLPVVSEQEQAAARMDERADRLRDAHRKAQHHLDEMHRQKNDLIEQRRILNDQIRRLPSLLEEIRDWTDILEGRKPNTTLQQLEQQAAKAFTDKDDAVRSLSDLIAVQSQRVSNLQGRFDGLVRQTLGGEASGLVKLDDEGVRFAIRRGESLSGEAYETLAVLLADLTLLLEGNSSHASHPGLLLHDSPREADLDLRTYHRLLETAESSLGRSEPGKELPFQYIVTTTTPPSARLQASSAMKLRLGSGKDSLFGRQLETPTIARPGPTLFDEEGDE
jgi:hypothetical protein